MYKRRKNQKRATDEMNGEEKVIENVSEKETERIRGRKING